MATRTPDPEPKVKMFKATLHLEFEAEDVTAARSKARRLLAKVLAEATPSDLVQRVVRAKYSSRADRLAEAESSLEDAKGIIEELHGELEQWYDGLPENLQGGNKASQLEEAIQALESVADEASQALDTCSGVEFPGMFG